MFWTFRPKINLIFVSIVVYFTKSNYSSFVYKTIIVKSNFILIKSLFYILQEN